MKINLISLIYLLNIIYIAIFSVILSIMWRGAEGTLFQPQIFLQYSYLILLILLKYILIIQFKNET